MVDFQTLYHIGISKISGLASRMYNVKVKNPDKLKKIKEDASLEQILIYSNHESIGDPFFTLDKFLEPEDFLNGETFCAFYKKEYDNTLLRRFIHLTGTLIPIDRAKTPDAQEESMNKFIGLCEKHKWGLLYPEGHRSENLGRFKIGPIITAIKGNFPILPIAIKGYGLNSLRKVIRREPVIINIGDISRIEDEVDLDDLSKPRKYVKKVREIANRYHDIIRDLRAEI